MALGFHKLVQLHFREPNAPPIQPALPWLILDSHMKLALDSMLLFIVAVKAVGIEYYVQYFNNIDLISFSLARPPDAAL